MGNLFDYLDWRGDIPFSADPFNDVDNLILSELSYTDFTGIVPGPGLGAVGVREAADTYFRLHTLEEVEKAGTFYHRAPLLLKKLEHSVRYADLKLSAYIDFIIDEQDMQMSALLFEVGDGSVYCAFRGTDDSIVGWKEDFNFSYKDETAGQRAAIEYVNRNLKDMQLPVRIEGHSKGGNFAVYAAAFCERTVQDRIIRVYSNDGPGFREQVINKPSFQAIADRVTEIIPESSIVGILLSGVTEKRVVKSSESGARQHDVLSWQVLGRDFVEAEKRSSSSHFFDQTVDRWLEGIDEEDRRRFIETLFTLFEATGARTLTELGNHKIDSFSGLLKGMKSLPKERQKEFGMILGKLIESGGRTLLVRGDKEET